MPDFIDLHPSAQELFDFAEGHSANAEKIEAHLDVCGECAEAVLTARRLRFQVDQKLIPPLSDKERAEARDRLSRFFESGGMGRASGENKESTNPAKPNATFWSAIGAVGAASALGQGAHVPKPLLAGRDDSGSQPTHKDDNPDPSQGQEPHHSQNSEDFVKSGNSDVTQPNNPASTHQKGSKPEPDEMDELLGRMDEILDTPQDSNETDSEQDHLESRFGTDNDKDDHGQLEDGRSGNDIGDLPSFDDLQQSISDDDDFDNLDDSEDASSE